MPTRLKKATYRPSSTPKLEKLTGRRARKNTAGVTAADSSRVRVQVQRLGDEPVEDNRRALLHERQEQKPKQHSPVAAVLVVGLYEVEQPGQKAAALAPAALGLAVQALGPGR